MSSTTNRCIAVCCKRRNFSDLTIIATPRKRYIFYSSLCFIQAGKKSLKIPGAISRNTADLRKPL
mgnify:CR=1 FL=1